MKIAKVPPELSAMRKNLLNVLINSTERKNFLETQNVFEPQLFDIYSKNPYPSGTMSNFKRSPFVIDGIECASIEGVLQSLKVIIPRQTENPQLWQERMDLQKEVCSYANNKAKRMGNFLSLFNQGLELNWRGEPLDRMSKAYQNFLKRIFEARYLADQNYRNAIFDTRNFQLTHKIGKHDKRETCLTEEEFLGMLSHLRTKFKVK